MNLKVFSVAAAVGLAAVVCANTAGAAESSAGTNSNGCKVVHLKPGENPPSGMSTSITAGNGQVSGHTTVGRGGNGVSVSSGSGGATASSGGAAASSVSTSSNGKTTTVTTSDGNCTVYIHDEK